MTASSGGTSSVDTAPEDYGWGTILASAEDEARKSTQGRRLVRDRVKELGKESIYNLTGLVRAFPLDPEDLPSLENQFVFYTHFLGQAEELAVRYTGADPREFMVALKSAVGLANELERAGRVIVVYQVSDPCDGHKVESPFVLEDFCNEVLKQAIEEGVV